MYIDHCTIQANSQVMYLVEIANTFNATSLIADAKLAELFCFAWSFFKRYIDAFCEGCLLQVFVFDRLVDDDKLTGDKHGPYDPALVRAYRSRRAQVCILLYTSALLRLALAFLNFSQAVDVAGNSKVAIKRSNVFTCVPGW